AQKLIVGPWTHGPTVHDPAFARYVGEMDFGAAAVVDFNAEHLRWYEHWLNGAETGVLDEPRVRYFLMGANQWRTADTWPPAATAEQPWYLHGDKNGSPNSLNDGGRSRMKPGRDRPDAYRYAPASPVPTVSGNTLYSSRRTGATGEENPDFAITAGPRDQRSIEPPCLTYTSPPPGADPDGGGEGTPTLFAPAGWPDTHFVAPLAHPETPRRPRPV